MSGKNDEKFNFTTKNVFLSSDRRFKNDENLGKKHRPPRRLADFSKKKNSDLI
jgi:hypothetical protein